jgi:hypothetical protein
VARTGSEAVLGEINRLKEDCKHLTDTMEVLGNHLLTDDELSDANN